MLRNYGVTFRKIIVIIFLVLAVALFYTTLIPASKVEVSLPIPVMRLDDFQYVEP